MPSPKPRGRHAVKPPAGSSPFGEAPWTSPASLAMAASHPSKRERMPGKPDVVVTRKLPDRVETRMMEGLFDGRLNLADQPITQANSSRRPIRRRPGAHGHRPDRCRGARPGRRPAQAHRLVRDRRRPHRSRHGPAARHHRHQYAGRPDRGHGGHDHGPHPRRAPPGRRGRAAGARRRAGRAGARPSCSAPARGQAARHRRHGTHRAPRWRGGPAASVCRSTITTGAACRSRWSPSSEATYWESLDQMLARMDIVSVNCPHTPATYHLLSARRLKLLRPHAFSSTPRGAR